MEEDDLHGIAQLVLSNREQLMLLRPVDKLLVLTDLHYAAEIREPSVFAGEVDKAEYKPNELALTKQLVGGMIEKKFDLANCPDPYAEKLKALVKAKTKGEELVARRTKRVGFVLSPPPPRAGRRGRGHRPRLAMPARRE